MKKCSIKVQICCEFLLNSANPCVPLLAIIEVLNRRGFSCIRTNAKSLEELLLLKFQSEDFIFTLCFCKWRVDARVDKAEEGEMSL
jgi:hypothetical protein